MKGDIDFYGLFVPELLVYAAAAFALQTVMSRGLAKLGARHLFWHPPLAETAIFIICLGGIAAAAHWVRP